MGDENTYSKPHKLLYLDSLNKNSLLIKDTIKYCVVHDFKIEKFKEKNKENIN